MSKRIPVAYLRKRLEIVGIEMGWAALTRKLGREPTHAEAKAEVKRILEQALIERAERGKLAHQRRR